MAGFGYRRDFSDARYFLDVFRKRVNYPELKKAVMELAKKWKISATMVEDKASGTQLIQELKQHTDLTLEPTVRRFGIPRELERTGIRRYGFHGLSYEFIARRLKELAPKHANGRILIAHLGNGASLCALRGGVSVDTSMGFSTLDGLLMGTRCGALDPGVIFYLLRQGMDASALENTLYTKSGLLGVSSVSSDMRVLLASADPRAKEAIDLFVFRVAREAAALAMTMGGLDGLVFTAGIGEHSPEIRRQVCERLSWMGLSLDGDANAKGLAEINTSSSAVKAWVIPTDEEAVIARHVFSLLA